MAVYSIRYVFQVPNLDGTVGTDGPFEGNMVIRAGSMAGALSASKLQETPALVQITGVFPANPTSFV